MICKHCSNVFFVSLIALEHLQKRFWFISIGTLAIYILLYVIMYICMYMYVCMYILLHVYMYVCMYVFINCYMYICMHVCMYVCIIYVCVRVWVCLLRSFLLDIYCFISLSTFLMKFEIKTICMPPTISQMML